MPDSEKFGDRDVDTFGHIFRQNGNTGDSKSSEAWYAESAYRRKDVWNRGNPIGKITRLKEGE